MSHEQAESTIIRPYSDEKHTNRPKSVRLITQIAFKIQKNA